MNIHELVRQKGIRINLSPRTTKTYQHCLAKFFQTTNIHPLKLKKKDIERYIHTLIDQNKSSSTINVHLSALKFFYQKVLKRKLTLYIEFQKNIKRLPEFLTQTELQKIFYVIQNPKHLLMVKIMYAAGLRVSELTNLKVKDLELDQEYLWVRQGKGRKDRATILAKSLCQELRIWIQEQQLEATNFLFPSYQKHRSLSTRTVYAIVKKAQKKAQIHKNIHPHSFRHSFATHLIEEGNSIQEIQPLLGHRRIDTTMKYLHLARPKLFKIQSPLDSINRI